MTRPFDGDPRGIQSERLQHDRTFDLREKKEKEAKRLKKKRGRAKRRTKERRWH